jgi:hypothetical protein
VILTSFAHSSEKRPVRALDAYTIKSLFEGKRNEEGDFYNLSRVKWREGAFTRRSTIEAIVSFFDNNQSHAFGNSEVWLLRHIGELIVDRKLAGIKVPITGIVEAVNSGWIVDRKLADMKEVLYEVVDIERDGKFEVWITECGGNQGLVASYGKLISLSPESESILYRNEGIDNTGFGLDEREGEVLIAHKVAFLDFDGDGILEILDVEERASYRWTGKIRDFSGESEYKKTSSTIKRSLLKLKNGQFKEVRMPLTDPPIEETISWRCGLVYCSNECLYIGQND